MRTAVLSDIHGHLPALDAVLADVDRAGVGRIVLTGDIAVMSTAWPDTGGGCPRCQGAGSAGSDMDSAGPFVEHRCAEPENQPSVPACGVR
jgi:hypothetical protein